MRADDDVLNPFPFIYDDVILTIILYTSILL